MARRYRKTIDGPWSPAIVFQPDWALRRAGDATDLDIAAMMLEPEAWLVVRRDHDGNLDVLRMPDGATFAWGLTESKADAVLAHVQRDHRKGHGQSYWKLSYPAGTLSVFLKANNIRA